MNSDGDIRELTPEAPLKKNEIALDLKTKEELEKLPRQQRRAYYRTERKRLLAEEKSYSAEIEKYAK